MDITLNLYIAGSLDLMVQGSVGLDQGGKKQLQRPPPVPRALASDPRASQRLGASRGQEMAQQIGLNHIEGDTGSPGSPLGQATSEAREAITAVKEALKNEDAQSIQQATEGLKQAATNLGEAVHRGGADSLDSDEPKETNPDRE